MSLMSRLTGKTPDVSPGPKPPSAANINAKIAEAEARVVALKASYENIAYLFASDDPGATEADMAGAAKALQEGQERVAHLKAALAQAQRAEAAQRDAARVKIASAQYRAMSSHLSDADKAALDIQIGLEKACEAYARLITGVEKARVAIPIGMTWPQNILTRGFIEKAISAQIHKSGGHVKFPGSGNVAFDVLNNAPAIPEFSKVFQQETAYVKAQIKKGSSVDVE